MQIKQEALQECKPPTTGGSNKLNMPSINVSWYTMSLTTAKGSLAPGTLSYARIKYGSSVKGTKLWLFLSKDNANICVANNAIMSSRFDK